MGDCVVGAGLACYFFLPFNLEHPSKRATAFFIINGWIMHRFLLLCAASLFIALSASAQLTSVSVRWMDHGPEDTDAEISREVGTQLIDNFRLRGVELSESGMKLFVRAQSNFTPEGEMVSISIVEAGRMRDEQIEAGAKAQIMYAGQPQPENVDEARFVRELVTKDWLEQLVVVHDMVLVTIPREHIPSEMSTYVDDLMHRTSCMANDTCE